MFSVEAYLAERQPRNDRFFTIAIDGRGSSGKTVLLEYLHNLHKDFTFLHGDDYWHHIADDILWGEFDEPRFAHEVIRPLQTGDVFVHSFYNFAAKKWEKRGTKTVRKVFCLERTRSFSVPLEWDLRIWIDTPKDVCMDRGVKRDTHHLGKSRALEAWNKWQITEATYIKENRPEQQADIVISGTKDFSTQIR